MKLPDQSTTTATRHVNATEVCVNAMAALCINVRALPARLQSSAAFNDARRDSPTGVKVAISSRRTVAEIHTTSTRSWLCIYVFY
jgi:hypothetical protein